MKCLKVELAQLTLVAEFPNHLLVFLLLESISSDTKLASLPPIQSQYGCRIRLSPLSKELPALLISIYFEI